MGASLNDLGLSRKHILDSVDASLKRLDTEYIDLYQVHAYDPTTPLDETLTALNDCVRAGKVRYIGCSNYSAWQLMKATALAKELGVARYDCLQPQYSLVCRYIEREHVPLCVEEGIGIIPWSPLGGGMLTGKIRRGEAPPQGSRASQQASQNERFTNEKNLDVAEALIQVAEKVGHTPSQVALSWCMNQPGVTAPIFGARTMAQLEDNIAAADIDLDKASLQALDDASKLEMIYPYDFHQMVRGMVEGRLA